MLHIAGFYKIVRYFTEAQIAEVRARKEAEKRKKDEEDRQYLPPVRTIIMFVTTACAVLYFLPHIERAV